MILIQWLLWLNLNFVFLFSQSHERMMLVSCVSHLEFGLMEQASLMNVSLGFMLIYVFNRILRHCTLSTHSTYFGKHNPLTITPIIHLAISKEKNNKFSGNLQRRVEPLLFLISSFKVIIQSTKRPPITPFCISFYLCQCFSL